MRPARELTSGRTFASLLALGAIAGLGQVPFSMTPLALFALGIAALLVRRAPSGRAAWWRGFACGVGYFGVTLHWIVEPFLVDVARHGWMAPFALLLLATGFALFWAGGFWLAHRLGRGRAWRFALSLGLSLAAVEMTRSYILTGFPWALLGYVYSEGPAAQLGAWIGPFGLTTVAAAGAGLVAIARGWAGRGLVAFLAWIVPVGLGHLVTPDPVGPGPDAPLLRLVQPNAPQDEKWRADTAMIFFERQLEFTAAASSDGARPDLIVWPETAVPFIVTPDHPAIGRIAQAAAGVPVLFGGQRLEGLLAYNALFHMDESGALAQSYDKHHLVPFGEYIPFGRLTQPLGLPSFAAQDGYGYTPGPGPQLLDLGPFGQVLPLICYEAIFPQDVAGAPSRPDWLLQVTNDAWFGTFAGPQQHLAQARMRAIEQGLPMARVANTGISGIIDPEGRLIASLELGRTGYLDVRLPEPRAPTLYSVSGDWPLAIALVGGLWGLAFVARRQKRA